MANYKVTAEAQTLETIMGDAFDSSKDYIIHVNDNAPSILAIIPVEFDDTTPIAYDGVTRGIELASFSDYDIGKDGSNYYLKSTLSEIDIFVAEKSV